MSRFILYTLFRDRSILRVIILVRCVIESIVDAHEGVGVVELEELTGGRTPLQEAASHLACNHILLLLQY